MPMRNHKLVYPQHLNHHGYLFGGQLLQWVDEVAWIAASREYPGCRLVTIALDKVEFRKRVKDGTVLTFDIVKARLGKTSVQYRVRVFCEDMDSGRIEEVFSTGITFVRVDARGRKRALPGNGG